MPEAPALLDELRARAREYLAPIAAGAPAGGAARLDPAYQVVAEQMATLDAPAGGEIDWKKVAAQAGALLKTRTKDLTLAAYLARALLATEGPAGLTVGFAVFAGVLEEFWETAFPELKRLRGRINATQWLVEKTQAALQSTPPRAGDLGALQALAAEVRRFADLVRSKFEGAAPAVSPLLELIERARATAEEAQPAPAPATSPTPAPTAPTPVQAAPAPQPPAAAAPPAFQAAPAAPAGVEGAAEYLRDTGTALASVGAALRRADLADASGYRVLRTGLWLHLVNAPPASAGKTSIPPPPENLRAALALMAQNQRWAALVEEAESALQQHRLWLDPHRLTAQALGALGPAHARAAEAVQAELRSLLGRLPGLSSLTFSDGTPLADAQTRSWLEEALTPRAAARRGVASADDDLPAERLSEARGLLAASQPAEGLAAFHALILDRPTGRPRFRARLALAQAAVAANLQAVALATYEELDREAQAHGLDAWDPALAAECLKGLVTAARALAKDPRGASPQLASQYQRLCRLDPAAAHEVWP